MSIADERSDRRRVSRTEPKREDLKGMTLVPSVEVPSGKIVTASLAASASEMEAMVLRTCDLRSLSTKIDGLSLASRPKTGQLATSRFVTNIAGKTDSNTMISSQDVWLATTIKGRIAEG